MINNIRIIINYFDMSLDLLKVDKNLTISSYFVKDLNIYTLIYRYKSYRYYSYFAMSRSC